LPAGQGRALGAGDYLTKPIQRDMLVRCVVTMLRDAEASSEAEAVDTANRAPPGLALIGLRMPAVSGHAALHALRADPGTRDIPALLMTDGLGFSAEAAPQ